MQKLQYDLIYLVACGVNQVKPESKMLEELEIEKLYQISCIHFLEALVGMSLKQAGISLPNEWEQRISKAVRKNILFDVEREKLLAFMEQNKIWHLPLKGIILKDFYPSVGMRQMSDNDILFDEVFGNEIETYMTSQGYKAVSVGKGNHDVYQKAPIYNFELHRALYGTAHEPHWQKYYKNVKERLVLDKNSLYRYHFTDEDFYVYIISHMYKHYAGSGTGIRSLLDIYVYLQKKEQNLDFSYIQQECKKLGIAEFENKSRMLCKKVFSISYTYDEKVTKETCETVLYKNVSSEEQEMLMYYLTSGVYGTLERSVENSIQKQQKKTKTKSKISYLLTRIFPNAETYKAYSDMGKYKCFVPFVWCYRILRALCKKDSRKRIIRELKIVKKV